MAKSRFSTGTSSTGTPEKGAVALQNEKAMNKIKSNADYVDAPIRPTNPHKLFDERTVFSTGAETAGVGKTQVETPAVADKTLHNSSSAYPLPSGAIAKAEVMLFSDPLNDTIVWEGNPRKQSEREDTSDIDEGIITSGLNVVPAIGRKKNGTIEIIEGSRRRESCARNHKPLLVIVVDRMSDDDAKIIAVLGNEGRKDPNIFSRIDGYKLLLEGVRPLCRSKADLARRLGLKREWVSQLMSIGDIPSEIKDKLSYDEVDALTAKRAIKLYKALSSLSEDKLRGVILWASGETEITVQTILDKIIGAIEKSSNENTKIGTMNIVSRHDNLLVVKNNNMSGLFIEFDDDVDANDFDVEHIKSYLKALEKKIG